MSDALIRATDRHVVTIFYSLFGLLNAPSWIHLAGFAAVGLTIDALAPRFLSSATINKDSSRYDPDIAYKNGWRWLYCLAGVYLVLDYGSILAGAALSSTSTERVGPLAFAIASPLSLLLRSHYEELLKDGYAAWANFLAIVYAGQFLAFYAAMALAFSICRCRFPGGAALRRKRGADLSKAKPWSIPVLLTLFTVLILFAIYSVTYPQIDYSDENLRSRHMNLTLRDHSKFVYDLAMFLSAICLLAPLSYQLLRFALLERRWLRTLADPGETLL
jgi:hypothetical protein